MPISYRSSILLLLKSLCQGNLSQIFLYYIILLSSLAISLACDPSTLPRGVQISTNGPVLKLTCEPELQPFEMAHFPNATSNTTTTNDTDPFPIPSKRKFARYVCMHGTSYQRVNPHGIELSHFFCADVDKSRCKAGLEFSPEHGRLLVHGSVAVWRSKSSPEGSILYCIRGVWHRLGDSLLPPGVSNKYQIERKSRLTAFTSTSTIAMQDVVTSTSTPSKPLSTRTTESPVKKSLHLNPIYLPRLRLPPFSSSRTHIAHTNSKSLSPSEQAFSSRPSKSVNVPQGSLIVISRSVSLALYDGLHRFTRVTFYCILAIGIATLIIGLMIYLFLCQRKARLAADEAEAQKRLKYTISLV
ncbi:hypothetical protein Aperf_G00000033253 [Anoplocephala perfoliata]